MNKDFQIKEYKLNTPKLKKGTVLRFSFITDLHGMILGEDNRELVFAVRDFCPDAVLCTGDMIVRTLPGSMKTAFRLLTALRETAPVFCSSGNHESNMALSERYGRYYEKYEAALQKKGICFLNNQSIEINTADDPYRVTGLEIPMIYYRKPVSPRLSAREIQTLAGSADPVRYNILLAHNPKYGKAYFDWGADLVLSGHYHGGVLRLSEHHGLTSPQFLLLPPYCCGDFYRGSQAMVVSAGLGEHTIPVRIHNPRELLQITVSGCGKGKKENGDRCKTECF